MENTPLNKAHEAGRRAVKLVRKGLLREAADCHLLAAGILQELLIELEQDSLCKRSLEEQVKFHKRQAELVKVLREFLETGYKLQKMAENRPPDKRKVLQPNYSSVNTPFRHPDIIRQLDDADSLLQILSHRKVNATPGADDKNVSRPAGFTIRPKNDSEIIEELRTVNLNLRAHIDKLLTELDECRAENKDLRQRLAQYENAKESSSENNECGNAQESLTQELLASTVAFQASLASRDENFEIPELDPLEVPECDLNEFILHH